MYTLEESCMSETLILVMLMSYSSYFS